MCTFRLYFLGYHFFAPQKRVLKQRWKKTNNEPIISDRTCDTTLLLTFTCKNTSYCILFFYLPRPQHTQSAEQMVRQKKATFCLRLITSTIDPDKNPFTTHTQSIQQAACQTSPKNLHSSLLLCTAHRQTNNSRLEGGCPLFWHIQKTTTSFSTPLHYSK